MSTYLFDSSLNFHFLCRNKAVKSNFEIIITYFLLLSSTLTSTSLTLNNIKRLLERWLIIRVNCEFDQHALQLACRAQTTFHLLSKTPLSVDKVFSPLAFSVSNMLHTLEPRHLGNGETAILIDTTVVYVHAKLRYFTIFKEIFVDEDVAQGDLVSPQP